MVAASRAGTIAVRGLTKSYGPVRVVDQLEFTVEPCTVTGFLGPSGAGKTTTLRMLLGLVRPDAGTATIGSRRYPDLPAPATEVGAVLEATGFHPARTGRAHLRVYCTVHQWPYRRADDLSAGYGGASTLVAVLAAIGVAGEHRHRTATATFLATPHRGRIVAAKLAAYPLVGAGYAAACTAVTAAIALPWLATDHVPISLTRNGIPATLAGVTAAVALYALLGIGLGALIRDQVATVVALLVYLFVAEPVITRIPALNDWTIYLPGPAANALTGVTLTNQHFLAPWQGGLLLAGYATALAAAGTLRTARGDIT
jgi:ABC-2 type transport system permease protein